MRPVSVPRENGGAGWESVADGTGIEDWCIAQRLRALNDGATHQPKDKYTLSVYFALEGTPSC